jgi:threonyl-tRNA synthetase
MRRKQNEAGYEEVNAPQVLDRALWEQSGHWENYHANMFITQTEDDRVFALKPMNCPGHVQIYKNGLKSYRDLPYKIAEFGLVHRYEPSGALHGLMRVRAFTQDDAHIFCTEDQIAEECLKINDLILSIYKDFGFDQITIKLSTRPEKRVGADELWDKAERAMRDVLQIVEERAQGSIKTGINEGEGAFYGPKFEYVLRDAIGREWQCGTTQVDFNLPGRFGAFYIESSGEKKTPVMIHRAMFGSLERFTGILIEHYAGHFPLWLAPLQIKVCTITQEADDYAYDILKALKAAGLRAEIDIRNEKINYKVREHSLAKVPVLLVVGKSEAHNRTVSVRRLGSQDQNITALEDIITVLKRESNVLDKKIQS